MTLKKALPATKERTDYAIITFISWEHVRTINAKAQTYTDH